MPGQRPILAMGFIASVGLTFIFLACTLPKGQGNFWPMLIFLCYILLPLPVLISRRIVKTTMLGVSDGGPAKIRDYALFATAGIIVSSIFMPIVLARSPVDKPAIAPISCFLVEVGNLLCQITVTLFCVYFKPLNY